MFTLHATVAVSAVAKMQSSKAGSGRAHYHHSHIHLFWPHGGQVPRGGSNLHVAIHILPEGPGIFGSFSPNTYMKQIGKWRGLIFGMPNSKFQYSPWTPHQLSSPGWYWKRCPPECHHIPVEWPYAIWIISDPFSNDMPYATKKPYIPHVSGQLPSQNHVGRHLMP